MDLLQVMILIGGLMAVRSAMQQLGASTLADIIALKTRLKI
jgi:hypothetical protein